MTTGSTKPMWLYKTIAGPVRGKCSTPSTRSILTRIRKPMLRISQRRTRRRGAPRQDLLHRQPGGIEDHGVGRRLERRQGARRIVGITRRHRLEGFLIRRWLVAA